MLLIAKKDVRVRKAPSIALRYYTDLFGIPSGELGKNKVCCTIKPRGLRTVAVTHVLIYGPKFVPILLKV
jgi:hypothetical protein